MTMRAMAWALEHDAPISPAAKLVLIVYANFCNARGWSYPSAATVQRISKLDIKTVRLSIDALEALGLLVDTGKKTGRTRQIKVYELPVESDPKTDAFPEREPLDDPVCQQRPRRTAPAQSLPKTDSLARRAKAPVFPGKDTQKRETEPSREPLPPTDPSGSVRPPRGKRTTGMSISEDWAPPPIADLPPAARRIAEQWPAGAYAAIAEGFLSHWLGESHARSRKRDWTRAWCKWIINEGAKPLRDVKAGMRFDTPAAPAAPAAPVDHSDEDAAALRIRATMRGLLGERAYANWLDPTIIRIDGANVTVVAPSDFMCDWLERHYRDDMAIAAAAAIGTRATMAWQADSRAFTAGARCAA